MRLQPWGATCLSPCRQQNICVCMCERERNGVCVRVCCKKEEGVRVFVSVVGVRVWGGFRHHTFTSTNNLRKNSIATCCYSFDTLPTHRLLTWQVHYCFFLYAPASNTKGALLRQYGARNFTQSKRGGFYGKCLNVHKVAFIINIYDHGQENESMEKLAS